MSLSPRVPRRSAGRTELTLLVSVTGMFLGLGVLFWISVRFSHESRRVFEEDLFRALRDSRNSSLTAGPQWLLGLARSVTAFGSAAVLGALTLIVAGCLALRRSWDSVAFVVATYVGAYGLSAALKEIAARARPEIVPHLVEVESLSFPSGHATASAAVYFGLAALLARATSRTRDKIFFFVVAALLVVAIGFSRVFLGVYFPTDVLAGWALGSGWALTCWVAARRVD